ncbi:HPP family protein [Mariprofundus ferrinatatus]|uniref:HPP family protein n=1 Tax=Mariprofundus ferrinatatus TaxID=1921087 RepID=A0A2K8L1E5_9PROT|nr:HPP family protein [Mariprofundus ferrinatatus]ATX81107.1 HPP family protein [Mariprofundus ferrinatatus]
MARKPFSDLIGIELSPSSHAEKLISGLGGFIAIFMIILISYTILGEDAYLIVASMGAATVLLFAVPHGPLSQPWPLFGGNLLSAIIGVICAKFVPDAFIAAGLAVGIAIAVMYYLKCIHPPGGATALSAVVGGASVEQLGYMYVVTPVLLNVLVIFTVALIFNYLFKWRRYPASLTTPATAPATTSFSHEGIAHALQQIDSFIDVSEDDLNRIYQLAGEYDRKRPE